MPPDVRILQPARAHLDAIIGLLAAEGWSHTEDSQRTWQALTAPGSTALVALAGEEAVGVAQILSDGEIQAFLVLLVVSRARRHQGIGRMLIGISMTATKPSTEELVIGALSAQGETTASEIAAAAKLGRSTAGKVLVKLERAGKVGRSEGGREGVRLPDRWNLVPNGPPPEGHAATERLRPGQLDGLVLAYLDEHGADAIGPTAVARSLGRSSGAVGNCLRRLATTERVRQVSEHPRRYVASPTSAL